MPDPKTPVPLVKNAAAAPMIFFDSAPVFGQSGGVVHVELAANYMTSKSPKEVQIEQTCTGHLRCSLAAAVALRSALDGAIKMASEAQRQIASARERMQDEYPQAAE